MKHNSKNLNIVHQTNYRQRQGPSTDMGQQHNQVFNQNQWTLQDENPRDHKLAVPQNQENVYRVELTNPSGRGSQHSGIHQLSQRGNSGSSQNYGPEKKGQIRNTTKQRQNQNDGVTPSIGGIISNPSHVNHQQTQPGHHKAHSMQISSKHKAQQLMQQDQIQTQNLNNFKNPEMYGGTLHGKIQNDQRYNQGQSFNNPSTSIYFNQKSGSQKSSNMKQRKGAGKDNYMVMDNSETVNISINQKNQQQKMMILQNAAEQQLQTQQTSQKQNSHILMNNQHVKMKPTAGKIQSVQQNQYVASPTQDVQLGGAKVIMSGPNIVRGGVISKNQAQVVGTHKKSNSLMNQKMMQLLMNKETSQEPSPGVVLKSQQNLGTATFQVPQNRPDVISGAKNNNFGIGGTNTVYHHGKSKSFMNYNDFASVGEEQNHNNVNSGGINAKGNNKKKIGPQQNQTPQMMNGPSQILPGDNTSQGFKLSKQKKSSHVGAPGSSSTTGPAAMTSFQAQAPVQTGPSNKSKIISNSFDKTSGCVQPQPGSLKSHKLGIKQQSFHHQPQKGGIGGTFSKKPTNQSKPLPSASINNSGVPTTMQSVTGGMITGIATQANPSGNQSVITGSSKNLHQLQKEIAEAEDQISLGGPNGISNHQRNKSDANYIQNLHNQNTQGKNNFVVVSSQNHVYPGGSHRPQKTQSKKATNLKAMSNNNQISQGATKGLLKYTKSSQQNQAARAPGLHPQQPGHTKNQYSTIVKSNYKNLVRGDGAPSHQNAQGNMVDLEDCVWDSSQNKTTEQKYAELKLKYNDLLAQHVALAAQRTEDHRDPKYKGGNGIGGQHYNDRFNGDINAPNSSMGGVHPSSATNQQHAFTQQQTLEPPQIIMNESHGSQGQTAAIHHRRGLSFGSRGSRGSKSSTREYRGVINGIRLSHDLTNQNYQDDVSHNQMVSILNEANNSAEAELNNIIGEGAPQTHTAINSHEVSKTQTPRGGEQSTMYMGSLSGSIGGGYKNTHNPQSAKNDRIASEGNSQNISTSNFAQSEFQSNIYQINLAAQTQSNGNNTGQNSIGSSLVSRADARGQPEQQKSTQVKKGGKGSGKIQQPYGASAGSTSSASTKNHKRSVSDGGIFNNMGLKAKAIQVAGGSGSFGPSSGAVYNQQQQIPLKERSLQSSQKTFEERILSMRAAQNGLKKGAAGQNPRYMQQNMMILEEGDDEQGERTNTQNTQISHNSNEENVHTEMGQEHSHEFNINPQPLSQVVGPQIQNQGNPSFLVRKQSTTLRQKNNGSHLSHQRVVQNGSPHRRYNNIYNDNGPSHRQRGKPIATDGNSSQTKNSSRGDAPHSTQSKKVNDQLTRLKKKKTKSLITDNLPDENVGEDINAIARKYKQMRKSGEYVQTHGGQLPMHFDDQILVQGQEISDSGSIPQQKPKAGHRRVKSGASDQTTKTQKGSNGLNKVVLFKNDSKQKKTSNKGAKQTSMKNLNNNNNGKQNQFMLIYEDEQNTDEEQEPSQEGYQEAVMAEVPENQNGAAFGPCTFPQQNNNHKKVINVSFNDFNQSVSNEYDDKEYSKDYADDDDPNSQRVPITRANIQNGSRASKQDSQASKNSGLVVDSEKPVGGGLMQQSSNKTLNKFMEALQKIRPQNPINSGSAPENAKKKPVANAISSQKKGTPMHKKTKSDMPVSNQIPVSGVNGTRIISLSGNNDHLRLEKYQKMLQKVKQNDKQFQQKNPNKKVHDKQQNKRREGAQSLDPKGQIIPQFFKESSASPMSDPMCEMAQQDQQSSRKNLKITFVGDQALLMQQQKKSHDANRIQFHQANSNLLNPKSNTGGQPSPIISTKRVPQKVLSQNGDGSLSPPAPGGKRTDGLIQQNNFLEEEEYTDDFHDQQMQLKLGGHSGHQNGHPHGHPASTPGPGNGPSRGGVSPLLQDETIEGIKPKQKGAQPSQGNKKKGNKKSMQNSNDYFFRENMIEAQVISDLDGSSNNKSPLEQRSFRANNQTELSEIDQQHLIQNLNKFSQFGEEEQIHIIDRPAPSGNQKGRIGSLKNPHHLAAGQQQPSPLLAPQVSERQERLVTEESNTVGGVPLTPRSKNIRKLIKLIRLGFRQNPPIPPETTIDFYRIGKILGKGAFGKVNLAVHKLTQCLCAVKSINKQFFSDDSQTKKVMQEVVMLKKTRHQNIVRLFEYFETEKHILFVIELCAGGDLLNYVRRRRRLKEDVAKCLFKQIIQSLAYCHSKSILHRDIKLDNILLDANGQVKICDFGVGKIVKKGEKMTEQCGTPAYIAPEILRDEGYYGFKVDIWSAGVVLYAMLYGTVPFKANNMTELQKTIMKAKYTLKDDISLEARDLLKGLLEKDPAKRLSISEILSNPWLQDAVDTTEIDLFTEQERQYIRTEYSYGKSSRYNRNIDNGGTPGHGRDPLGTSSVGGFPPDSELDKDMFTEHMLDSTQNSILKNCETKSVILAPFNSTKSNLQEEENADGTRIPMELSDSIKALIEPNRIIKFGPRVRDIDKQYEINNNADLDNGVYHKFDEDEAQEEENQNTEQSKSKSDEIAQPDLEEENESQLQLDPEEQEILKELKQQGIKKKQGKEKSELQRLENMIHDQEEKEKQTIEEIGGNLVTENSNIQQLENTMQSEELNTSKRLKTKSKMNIQESKVNLCLKTEESQISSPDQKLALLYQTQLQNEQLQIDEDILFSLLEFGYPRNYLLNALKNNELNYATTGYLLLYLAKKMQEVEYMMANKLVNHEELYKDDQQENLLDDK